MFDNQRKKYPGASNTTSMPEYKVVRLRGIVTGMPREVPLKSHGVLIEFSLITDKDTRWETIYTISALGERKAFIEDMCDGDEIDCTCWLNSRESGFKPGRYYLSLSLREISQTRPTAQVSAEKADAPSDGVECATEPAEQTETESLWGPDDFEIPF